MLPFPTSPNMEALLRNTVTGSLQTFGGSLLLLLPVNILPLPFKLGPPFPIWDNTADWPVLCSSWERKWVASRSLVKCSYTFRGASTRSGQPADRSRVKLNHQNVSGALGTFSPASPTLRNGVRPQSPVESRTL